MIQKKICMLGASGVGKTSLVSQFVDGVFSETYLTTIGVKVDKKWMKLDTTDVQFMLWDIEGVDRYSGFKTKYMRGAAAYIIVMDQSRSQSLIEGMEIHDIAREVCDAPAFLAINKCDLDMKWHWEEEELQDYRKQFNATYLTSAKTGENVENLFTAIASKLVSLTCQ